MALTLNEAYTNEIQSCPNLWVDTPMENIVTWLPKTRGTFYENIMENKLLMFLKLFNRFKIV